MVNTVKSYSNFKNFRKYVLEISMKEINELTDISVEYEPITKGRKVVMLKFIIKSKEPIQQCISHAKVRKALGDTEKGL